jgi:hypothetical protein
MFCHNSSVAGFTMPNASAARHGVYTAYAST